MSWIEATVQKKQVHLSWLVVKDKGYHRERLDSAADTIAAAADAGKVVVAVKLGLCLQR